MSKVPVSEQVQVNFRMPVKLRDRIRATAEKNGTSMNAEIVSGLEAQFPAPRTPADVVGEIAMSLAYIPPKLRTEAIDLLAKAALNGSLERCAEFEEIVLKEQGWSDFTFNDE